MIDGLVQEHGAAFVLGCTITAPAVWAFLSQTILGQAKELLDKTEKGLEECKQELRKERQAHLETLRKIGGL